MPNDTATAIQNLQDSSQKLEAQRTVLKQASRDPARPIQERLDLLGQASDHVNAVTKNEFLIAILTASQHTVSPPSPQDVQSIKGALASLAVAVSAQQATDALIAISIQGLGAAKTISGNIQARTT